MPLAPFVLYGLVGCPHCIQSEGYLKKAGIPYTVFVVNDDPIAEEGIKKITGKEPAEYPALLYKITKEIVVGYKPDEYERLVKAFYSLVSANTPSAFSGGQPDIPQTT